MKLVALGKTSTAKFLVVLRLMTCTSGEKDQQL
jgi:hypothetical protein